VVEDGVAEDEVEALVLEGQLLGLGWRPSSPRARVRRRWRPSRCSIPGEMSVARQPLDHAELHQVE
jgi:hypothetical protein